MDWIRVATALPNDPKVHELGATLRISVDVAIAKFCRVLFALPTHARDGNLSRVLPTTVESWADWRGKKGAFDAEFRRLFCTNGVVTAWEKHNGSAIRRADDDRERKRKLRNPSAGQNADSPQDEMRDGTGRDVDGNPVLPDTNAEGVQYLSGASGQRADAAPSAPKPQRGANGLEPIGVILPAVVPC